METVTKLYQLFVKSTADPEKFSLTLKSVVSFVFLFYGWGSVDKEAVESAVGELGVLISNAAVLFGEVVALIYAFVGGARKIKNIIKHSSA